jgi:uncharacterized protein (DUF1697 family)
VAAAGGRTVRTYLQSGNAVFESDAEPAALAPAIEARLLAEAGLDVRTLVRRAEEMAALAASNPFAEEAPDRRHLHVTFLADAPTPERVALLPPERDGDRLSVRGREVFLHCPRGYAETRLNGAYLERALRTVATTRNWTTVLTLAALCGARRPQ